MDPKKKRSKIKVQKCVQHKMRKRRESKKREERRGWMGRRERPRKEGRKERAQKFRIQVNSCEIQRMMGSGEWGGVPKSRALMSP